MHSPYPVSSKSEAYFPKITESQQWNRLGHYLILIFPGFYIPQTGNFIKDTETPKHRKGIASKGLPGGSDGKESACKAGDPGLIPGWGRSPGEGMATQFSILAWRIPWTEEWDGLQSMGSQRVGHNWKRWAMATHSSTLAWKILWTEKPGRLQSMGWQRVGHDWATSLPFLSNV